MPSGNRQDCHGYEIFHPYPCHEHTTNLATGVSRQPVLDCGTIFHPDCGSRDFASILSDDL